MTVKVKNTYSMGVVCAGVLNLPADVSIIEGPGHPFIPAGETKDLRWTITTSSFLTDRTFNGMVEITNIHSGEVEDTWPFTITATAADRPVGDGGVPTTYVAVIVVAIVIVVGIIIALKR